MTAPAREARVGGLALRWSAAAILWLALSDSRRWQELAIGAVAATLATAVSALLLRPGDPRTARNLATLARLGPARLLRPPALLVVDSWRVARALGGRARGRELGGGFRAKAYRPDPPRQSATGRALTELLGSVPANRYVVGIDEDEGSILVHELVRSDEPLDPLESR